MKALTISQPFASLIASGEKWIENRTWPTNYRGELAIHAGKGLQYLSKDELAAYPNGCVIAIARLVACKSLKTIREMGSSTIKGLPIPGCKVTWEAASQHKHAEGPYCWIIEDVRLIDPVKINGKQGLWDFELSIAGA